MIVMLTCCSVSVSALHLEYTVMGATVEPNPPAQSTAPHANNQQLSLPEYSLHIKARICHSCRNLKQSPLSKSFLFVLIVFNLHRSYKSSTESATNIIAGNHRRNRIALSLPLLVFVAITGIIISGVIAGRCRSRFCGSLLSLLGHRVKPKVLFSSSFGKKVQGVYIYIYIYISEDQIGTVWLHVQSYPSFGPSLELNQFTVQAATFGVVFYTWEGSIQFYIGLQKEIYLSPSTNKNSRFSASILEPIMPHRSFKPAKCKTSLKLASAQIKLLKNKKEIQLKQLKKEVAQLLESGQDRTARIRV
ncbi:uncharacterized protein LOC132305001 [Cornus florida]|uniref:uncharacterized protein LOC132305001 n=1 Tax=Cornus florida TaxID=4283 RepID=UPI002898EB91|nr:uncharacterized protein LOC132305001 [Cornus florida]